MIVIYFECVKDDYNQIKFKKKEKIILFFYGEDEILCCINYVKNFEKFQMKKKMGNSTLHIRGEKN
jgi:hypothetical protein